MKNIFNIKKKYSIRKLTIGTASVFLGMVFLGAGTTLANEEKTTENTVNNIIENTNIKKFSNKRESESSILDISNKTDENINSDKPVVKEKNAKSSLKIVEKTDKLEKDISINESFRNTSETNTNELSNTNETNTTNNTVENNFKRKETQLGKITNVSINENNKNIFDISYESGQKGKISFYGDHIIRYHIVPKDEEFLEKATPRDPNRPADILVKKIDDYSTSSPILNTKLDKYEIKNDNISIMLDKNKSTLKIVNNKTNKTVLEELEPLDFSGNNSTQVLKSGENTEYFGGGTQNGRFTHKGQKINIANENNWVDGGVASPNPFYWTTDGYGVLRHTFKEGKYDFENTDKNKVITNHKDSHFDAFYFINSKPVDIIKDYYELTGKPVVLPIFALYQGHLNAYNRDTWVEVPENTYGSVYFEELGKWYKEFQPGRIPDVYKNNKKLNETLNANKNDENYAFTARAVLDRYKKHDMPLGWMLVNDGYGAGYGKADTLEGNIENLKQFSEYALKNGVKTGLWTQSDLHPKDGVPALLQRDLDKEVEKGLVRVLKTDVAWVGHGYSFGLNGITDAAKIMTEKGNNARPFIITLDGWGGTQRYGGIWTGDQTGGNWEYIRFHIPTYIGTSLSGQPNVSSDMDGIFGGANKVINTRDFQWKTFTPMQLNMDGWGSNPKTPFAFDATTSDINRSYLKLKSMLIPYSYSIGHEAKDGNPMIRAMFLEFPEEKINYTDAVKYQFMYGENFLVAPVYKSVKNNPNGDDVRNGIYLPKGEQWIDYFTGAIYEGGQVLNNFETPLWKLPIFVKNGAIIPITDPHNNFNEINKELRQVDFYPNKTSSFVLIEDDGLTQDYLKEKIAKTKLDSVVNGNTAILTMQKTDNKYDNFVKNKVSQFNVNVSKKPKEVKLFINDIETTIREVKTLEEFKNGTNVYFYDQEPNLNQFSTEKGAYYNQKITKNPVVRVKSDKLDVTENKVELKIEGFEMNNKVLEPKNELNISAPTLSNNQKNNTSNSITLSWTPIDEAISYDLEIDGILHRNIKDINFIHEDLKYKTNYNYKVRGVKKDGVTPWSSEILATTKDDPFRLAIKGISIRGEKAAQGGQGFEKLVDLDFSNMYHSKWGENAIPENITFNLNGVYELENIVYIPRDNAGNGTIKTAKFSYSVDGIHWHEFPTTENWATNNSPKKVTIPKNLKAGFIKMNVTSSVGNFVSGKEMLFFKKDGTLKKIAGDVTADGNIDSNDVTSFQNYAGLRNKIDKDFEGYVEVADLNENGVIDAYDIQYATSKIGKNNAKPYATAKGVLKWTINKETVNKDDEILLTLTGKNLENVEAINSSLKIDTSKYTVIGDINIDPALSSMYNFSRVRTHGDNSKEAFVILTNDKDKQTISGTKQIATLRLRALTNDKPNFTFENPLLIGSNLLPVKANKSENNPDTKQIENSRIKVSGAKDVYQPNHDVDKLIDGNENTLTELKWNYPPNYVNGAFPSHIKLPQEITFEFNNEKPTYLNSMEIIKRTPGNGTVTKYKIEAYKGDKKIYDSNDINVAFEKTNIKHNFDKTRLVDKVVLTILEAKTNPSNINNTMMTLKEVKFFEQPNYSEVNIIPKQDLNVSGNNNVYEINHNVDKLNDGNLNTLTELKYDIPTNHINGKLPEEISLPQEITFTLKENLPRALKGLKIHKRPNGNGTVTKYKVTTFNGKTKTYESQIINTQVSEESSTLNFEKIIKANKLILTILEAKSRNIVNNQMMTLREVDIFEVDKDLLQEEKITKVSDNPPKVKLPEGNVPKEVKIPNNPPTFELPNGEIPKDTKVPETAPTIEDKPVGEIPKEHKVPNTFPTVQDKPVWVHKIPEIAPTAQDKPIGEIHNENSSKIKTTKNNLTHNNNDKKLANTGININNNIIFTFITMLISILLIKLKLRKNK